MTVGAITIRKIDDALKQAMREEAAANGRSIEAEVRALLDKAATVEHLLLESGVRAAEVVAFGDMPNDRELIEWAGLGVAMGNGHPDLKAVADEVTASNDDDGVALVVERLLTGA